MDPRIIYLDFGIFDLITPLNICILIILLDFVGKNSSVKNNFGFLQESSKHCTVVASGVVLSTSSLDCILFPSCFLKVSGR